MPSNLPMKRSYRVQVKRTGTDWISVGTRNPFHRQSVAAIRIRWAAGGLSGRDDQRQSAWVDKTLQ
jgi:hypothetical protein